MKTHKQIHLLFAIALFVLSACTKTKKDSDPGPLTDSDNLVLVPTNKDTGTLTALDGRTGTVKWEIPFNGNITVQAKTLYLNQIKPVSINDLADTTLLFTNPDKQKNLVSVDASNGQVLTSVFNTLRPNYMLGYSSTAQINRLIGLENGTAFMVLSTYYFGIVKSASIYATDLETGSVKWEYKLPSDKVSFTGDENSSSRTSLKDGRIYVGGNTSSFVLDASTGKHIYDYSIGSLTKPVEQTFYSVPMNHFDKVLAVDSKSGTVQWEFKPDMRGIDWIVGQPLVHKDLVYICTSDGLVSAIDSKSGLKKWELRVNYPSPHRNHKISIKSEVLFATSLDGKLYALDPATGDLKWEVSISDLDKNTVQTMETKNTLHYIETKSGIVAVDSKTGQKVWKWNAPQSSLIKGLHVYDKTELSF